MSAVQHSVKAGEEQAAIDKAREARGEKVEGEEKPKEKPAEAPAEEKPQEGAESPEDKLSIKKDDESGGGGDEGSADEGNDDGVDFEALYAEWAENSGDLTPETRERVAKLLEEAGFPPNLLDTHIAGLNAMRAQRESDAYQRVGGEENYAAMTEWAKENLSPAEVEAFNAGVAGSPEQAAFAVEGLFARYQSATGSAGKPAAPREPSLKVSGRPAGGSGKATIPSRADLAKKIADPRYKTDEGFRTQVQEELRASLESGSYLTTD